MDQRIARRVAIASAAGLIGLIHDMARAADGCRRQCRCINGQCCDVRRERHANGSCVTKRALCGVRNTRCDCAGGCL